MRYQGACLYPFFMPAVLVRASVYVMVPFFCFILNRYRICYMATDDEKEAEFVFFDRVGRDIVGKPLVSLLRSGRSSHLSVDEIINSVRGDNSIPRELAALVSQKYRFVVSFSSKSYLPESLESSFQVHRIDLSLGYNSRSSAMQRKSLSAGASGSGQVPVPAGSATSVSHGAVPPELLSPSDPNLVESTDDLPTDASSAVVSFFSFSVSFTFTTGLQINRLPEYNLF